MSSRIFRNMVCLVSALLLILGITEDALYAQALDWSLDGEVYVVEQDMDARTFFPERDQNDKLCALIKVRVTNHLQHSLLLETGAVGVVKRLEREDGETWFWVPYQVRNLKFSCQGYAELPLVPVKLESGKVYRLTLRTDTEVKTVLNVQANYAFLKLQIKPEQAANALVSVGKTTAYETDVRYAEDGYYASPLPLDYGQYYYKVEHELFKTETGTLFLDASAVQRTIELKPAYGFLKITSEPTGAILSINGKRMGTTPWTSQALPEGSVQIRLQANNYALMEKTVEVIADGSMQSHDFQLEGLFGLVTCVCEMEDAELWVDHEYKGMGSWSGLLNSQVPHILEVRKPGHQSQSISFTVIKGQSTTERIPAPVPMYGTLVLSTIPSNAQVEVDGRSIGTSPLVQPLLVGLHTVRVSKSGYQTATFDVQIRHNERVDEQRTLKEEALEKQSESQQEDRGKFTRITMEHNVEEDGVKGMNLLLDFSVKGMKDQDGRCSVYFYDQDGVALVDKNGNYRTSDGKVSVGRDIRPGYEESWYTDYKIFMPYSELELAPGTYVLKFYGLVWDRSVSPNEQMVESSTYEFKFEKGADASGALDQGSTVEPITGEIKDITVEHNFVKDGVKGMKILVDFEVQHMRGVDGSCDVFCYFENGDPVKGKTSDYQTSKGNLTTSANINPRYDDTVYTDFELFVPYKEFDVGSGKYDMKFRCWIYERSNGTWKTVASSEYRTFTFTR